MDRKLKDFKGGGKMVLPDGGEHVNDKGKTERIPLHYKLRTVDFKTVMGGSGAPYVVVDVVVINQCEEQGSHTELGFSMGEASESFAKAWFEAMEVDEEAIIPGDKDRLQRFLTEFCKSKVIQADITIGENKGYQNNQVSPPWAVGPAELDAGDLAAGGAPVDEQPRF